MLYILRVFYFKLLIFLLLAFILLTLLIGPDGGWGFWKKRPKGPEVRRSAFKRFSRIVALAVAVVIFAAVVVWRLLEGRHANN